MYEFQINREKKLLIITLKEYISAEESIAAAKKFWSGVAHIGNESIVICDIRRLKSSSRPARVLLQRLMKLLSTYKPKAVIRILDNFNGAMIFDRAYNNTDVRYYVHRVDNLDDALEIVNTYKNLPPVFNKMPSKN